MAAERSGASPRNDVSRRLAGDRLAIDGGLPAVPEGPPGWPLPDAQIRDIVLAALEDGSWGQYHADFSTRLVDKLCAMHGVDHALTCCSGTFAVELALRGLRVRAGEEVILAGYDFPGNFRAVEAVGAFPVLVDIDPQTWCLDPARLAQAMSSKTRAIIVSHLHGGLADMKQITDIAHGHRLSVVEDACQAQGAQVQGRPAGAWGDVGVLSFGGSKLLTAGRGGAILTGDAAVYQRAKVFVERGNDAFPLSGLQAAVLLPQLDKLVQRNGERRERVQLLLTHCRDLPLIQPISISAQCGEPSYYKVALRLVRQPAVTVCRERFIEAVQAEGVALGPGFRGFVRRSTRRCRIAESLVHSAAASADTMLLHHPALLQPADHVRRIAVALHKVALSWVTRVPGT